MHMKTDVIIIGAGAAGLMSAIEAGKRGRQVLIFDHANKPGKKILMSGGGRCNFTNEQIHPAKYISHNPHFCKSALSRYTQWDFIELVNKYAIPFHEKKLGQLFCDNKAKDILEMLLAECDKAGVQIQLNTPIEKITKTDIGLFEIETNHGRYACESLVIATGGLSIPTMGATPFGYKIAEQFGIKVLPVRAGLVPFTLHAENKTQFEVLSGVACDSIVEANEISFRENMLFTHRGLSGPSMLQISNYWLPGDALKINFLPDILLSDLLKQTQKQKPNTLLKDLLGHLLPKRLALNLLENHPLAEQPLQVISHRDFDKIGALFQNFQIKPNGTEGYRTAEVTIGGVDTHELSSKTFESHKVKGLYFIGEVVDVTGWLGGYNFQWAWSSGWAAGQVI
jgi:predicted Rossmann fold flavoprotein